MRKGEGGKSQLADLALVAGAGVEHDRIDAEVVSFAHHEWGAVKV
jgi:hypothetical protein